MARCFRRGLALGIVAVAAIAAIASGGCENKHTKTFIVEKNELPPPHAPAFGTARPVDPPPATSTSAAQYDHARGLALDGAGNGLLAIRADDGTGVTRLYVVRYDASLAAISNPFSSAQLADANTGGNVNDAKVVLDASGDGLLLFVQVFQGKRRLYARNYRAATNTFTAPTLVDSGGANSVADDVTNLDVALTPAGNGAIVFSEADDVFGIFFRKSDGSFTAPQQLDTLGNVGNTVSALRVLDRGGAGVAAWLQDSDTSAGTVRVLAASRYSTSGSLAFSWAQTVNSDTATDITDYDASILSSGTSAFVWTQSQSGGGSRVFGRTLSAGGSFGTAADLGASVTGTFAGPLLRADGSGNAVLALRRDPSGANSQLYGTTFSAATGTFSTSPARIDDAAAGAVIAGSYAVAVDVFGQAEIGYVQRHDPGLPGSHPRVHAVRYVPSTGFGASRRVDHGSVETGPLVATPAYASPTIVRVAFDPAGRCFLTYTQSDGHLERLYVVSSLSGQPGTFGAPETVDGASRNSVFAASAVTSQVVSGDGSFTLAPSGATGLALTRQAEVNGTTNVVRLYATPFTGYDLRAIRPQGSRLLDGFRDAISPRDVAESASGLDAAGAGLVAFTQSDGTATELFAVPFYATQATTATPGGSATSVDNGTTGVPSKLRVVMDPSRSDGQVFFLQDDGTGRTQLYARRYVKSSGAVLNVGTSPTPTRNEPISLTGSAAGSVVSYDVAHHAPDGASYLVFRQVKNTATGAAGVFAVKVSASGALTGPAEHSDPNATVVGDPKIKVNGGGHALTVFNQGNPPILCSRYSTSSSLGASVMGLPPVVSASATAACGNFSVDDDAAGNFLVAFERDDSGSSPAKAIFARRWLASTGQWEGSDAVKISDGTATMAAPALSYSNPVVAMSAGGDAAILYRQDDDRPALDTVNLAAVTFQASAGAPATAYSSPQIVDNGDGTVPHGADVTLYGASVRRADGNGAALFIQDADPGSGSRPRIYTRRFHLANLASATPVFETTSTDLSEGSGAATRVTGFTTAFDAFGVGYVVFTEASGADADSTRTHLFARAYSLVTGVYGPNWVVSRALATGDGTAGSGAEGENSAVPQVSIGGDAMALIPHLVTQDSDGSTPATVDRARLFGNVIR